MRVGVTCTLLKLCGSCWRPQTDCILRGDEAMLVSLREVNQEAVVVAMNDPNSVSATVSSSSVDITQEHSVGERIRIKLPDIRTGKQPDRTALACPQPPPFPSFLLNIDHAPLLQGNLIRCLRREPMDCNRQRHSFVKCSQLTSHSQIGQTHHANWHSKQTTDRQFRPHTG